MLYFTIKNLSGFLSPSEFVVKYGSQEIYHIKETITSPFKRLISFTRFRMLLSLELELIDLESNKTFRVNRKVSYPYNYFTITGEDNFTLVSFEPMKKRWKWISLRSLTTYIVKDSKDEITGTVISKNPTIIGHQHGEVKDLAGQTIATFEWKGFSLWKGHRECELLIERHDKNWILISIVAAVIKGLYLQQR